MYIQFIPLTFTLAVFIKKFEEISVGFLGFYYYIVFFCKINQKACNKNKRTQYI